MDMLSMMQLLIAGYLLYSAITGKGKLYENANIKKGMEEKYHKMMRLFAWILSPLMLAQIGLEHFGTVQENLTLLTVSQVMFGGVTIAIIALVVVTVRMTDRSRARYPKNGAPVRKDGKHAGFDFDDEDNT